MAVSLFGREVPEFSTFGRAFNACFAALMGEFDYEEMYAEAREMAPIWFWLFQALMALLMLNMLLAIIMDTYAEVKGMTHDLETLPQQLFILVRRWQRIRLGYRLPLEKIDNKMTEVFGKIKKKELRSLTIETKFVPEDIITVEVFADKIEGMEIPQAKRLITLAVRNWRLEQSVPLTLSEAMTVIGMTHQQQLQHDKAMAHLESKLDQTNAELAKTNAEIVKMAEGIARIEQLLVGTPQWEKAISGYMKNNTSPGKERKKENNQV
eukprot:gnl/MRDRNA2_/MRDRNA2_125564_c0_seq1.p1 gnl/MRDRNA2_/MRDRNA2_125564_c0~~gnl/MRDRNA2_/MRDRNA2_125564_c0_seq1.p1  ORF type:complete len:285 (-),score=50.89 gnl/MRDRNA2_/MRDRNA2_125564_c0_seq1:333-1130(-)